MALGACAPRVARSGFAECVGFIRSRCAPSAALISVCPRGVAECSPPCHGGDRGFKSHRGRLKESQISDFRFQRKCLSSWSSGVLATPPRSRSWVRIPPGTFANERVRRIDGDDESARPTTRLVILPAACKTAVRKRGGGRRKVQFLHKPLGERSRISDLKFEIADLSQHASFF